MVDIYFSMPDALPFSCELIENLVRSTMHAQHHVETLEIFCPDLAESLHLSTAMVIAALQRIAGEGHIPPDRKSVV